MKNLKLFASGAAILLTTALMVSPVSAIADGAKSGTMPPPPTEQPPQTAQKADPAPSKEDKSGEHVSGPKQAGRDINHGFKKFGHDVGEFFDGLFE